ncbi:25314_t:CDS:1, partial [Racocetra persica]
QVIRNDKNQLKLLKSITTAASPNQEDFCIRPIDLNDDYSHIG